MVSLTEIKIVENSSAIMSAIEPIIKDLYYKKGFTFLAIFVLPGLV